MHVSQFHPAALPRHPPVATVWGWREAGYLPPMGARAPTGEGRAAAATRHAGKGEHLAPVQRRHLQRVRGEIMFIQLALHGP